MYKKISVYDYEKNLWSSREFITREDYIAFLESIFKEPGKYEFDESSLKFYEQATIFEKEGIYCSSPFRSLDFIAYWDSEKDKCINGVIFTNKKKTWYLPGYYYMWLNFLRIYNKEIKKYGFAKLRDAQYHMALYEELAEANQKHSAILKKRQIASSYFHAARLIHGFWFFEGFVGKIAASLKDYINEKGTWRFLEEYRNFLNEHTAWYRPCNPDKTLNWEQKIEVTQGGRKKDVGLKSVILGYALDKDPTNGVGGPCSFFFHEEAGVASKMTDTLEYLLPALKSGIGYTGHFVAAGSVGDLEQCEPLKSLLLRPDSMDVFAVKTDLLNEDNEVGMCGLFIPEQWSMMPSIDEYGNSLVENAVDMIIEERKIWKKSLTPEQYQLRVSQKPLNIEEAFAHRKISVFPMHLVNAQMNRIKDKEYFLEYIDLSRNEKDEIEAKASRKLPITEFPIRSTEIDKTGVLVVHERPDRDAAWGTYLASIDPVSEGKTTTSDSLCAIYVYKTQVEKIVHKDDGTIESSIEGDKIVAWWCGRYDDLNDTHQMLENIIEWYKAWTIVENNVHVFIQYMMHKRKQKYLVPKSQMLFLKELAANTNSYQEYGWRNVGTIFKTNLLSYGVQSLTEELDRITKPDGEVVKTIYGVERIPDIMILEEMKAYREGLNVDRLVAYCALVAFVTIQKTNRGYVKKVEHQTKKLETPNKNTKLKMSPFKTIGKNRNPFKNIR